MADRTLGQDLVDAMHEAVDHAKKVAKRGRLTLSRRGHEWIVIIAPDGREIRVKASKRTGSTSIAITVDAPLDYEIAREETLEEVGDV